MSALHCMHDVLTNMYVYVHTRIYTERRAQREEHAQFVCRQAWLCLTQVAACMRLHAHTHAHARSLIQMYWHAFISSWTWTLTAACVEPTLCGWEGSGQASRWRRKREKRRAAKINCCSCCNGDEGCWKWHDLHNRCRAAAACCIIYLTAFIHCTLRYIVLHCTALPGECPASVCPLSLSLSSPLHCACWHRWIRWQIK